MTRTVIAKWRRNAREEIAIAFDRYQGVDTIDLRCWYEDADGEKKPGKTGIALAISRHLEPLAAALNAALATAHQRGLLTRGGGK